MLRIILNIIFFSFGVGILAAQPTATPLVNQKINLIYKYGKYVSWKADPDSSKFSIVYYGKDSVFYQRLKLKLEPYKLKGKPISIAIGKKGSNDVGHIVLVDDPSWRQLKLSDLNNSLLITDGFSSQSSMMTFLESEGQLSVVYNDHNLRSVGLEFKIPFQSITNVEEIYPNLDSKVIPVASINKHLMQHSWAFVVVGLVFALITLAISVIVLRRKYQSIYLSLSDREMSRLYENLKRKSLQIIRQRKDAFVGDFSSKSVFVWAFEAEVEGLRAKQTYILFGSSIKAFPMDKAIQVQLDFEAAIWDNALSEPDEILTFMFDSPTFVSGGTSDVQFGLVRLDEYGMRRTGMHFATTGLACTLQRSGEGKILHYPVSSTLSTKTLENIDIYKFDLLKNDSIYFLQGSFLEEIRKNEQYDILETILKKHANAPIGKQFREFDVELQKSYGGNADELGISFVGIRI